MRGTVHAAHEGDSPGPETPRDKALSSSRGYGRRVAGGFRRRLAESAGRVGGMAPFFGRARLGVSVSVTTVGFDGGVSRR